MFLPDLLASAFSDFAQKYLAYIIVGLMVIVFIVIVIIAAKTRRKPTTYTSDEIDRSVDKAALEKAARKEELSKATEENEAKQQPAIAEEEQPTQPEEQTVQEPQQVQQDEEQDTEIQTMQEALASEEDANEELTFEAEDVEEPAPAEQKEAAPAKRKTVSYRILYDKETKTWEIRKDNAKRVIRRVKTKKEALEIAQELCEKQELNLVVHKKDGKFQKKRK